MVTVAWLLQLCELINRVRLNQQSRHQGGKTDCCAEQSCKHSVFAVGCNEAARQNHS